MSRNYAAADAPSQGFCRGSSLLPENGTLTASPTAALAIIKRSALALDMRRVLKSDKRPLEIKPQAESVWICMCGLSKNQPFCDGSHKTTKDEEDGKIYDYDAEGHRHEI